jgi:DNA-binding transcriptional ArsR family regulator
VEGSRHSPLARVTALLVATIAITYFDNSRNIVDSLASCCQHAIMKIDDAAAHLEALGNPTRLKIYRALIRAGGAGLAVGRLQEKLKIAPSTLSHHIKALVVVGLVTQVRDATTLICHANYGLMRELVSFLVAECCAESAERADAKTSDAKAPDTKTAA